MLAALVGSVFLKLIQIDDCIIEHLPDNLSLLYHRKQNWSAILLARQIDSGLLAKYIIVFIRKYKLDLG